MPNITINGNTWTFQPNMRLSYADLHGVDLHDQDLRGASLQYCNLRGANLRGAILEDVDLYSADLTGADLTGARMIRARCRRTTFDMANLTDVQLRRADLTYALFRNANLTRMSAAYCTRYGTSFEGADLTDARIPCEYCAHIECTCEHCDRCHDRIDSGCDACGRGRSCGCCECDICNDCGGVCNDNLCPSCSCCSGCCQGHEERPEIPTGIWPTKIPGEIRRLAGVEYETIDRPNAAAWQWARDWGAGWHEDGSCGWEAVTPPCAGSNIDKCLTALGRVIGSTNSSCGLHVHVDARDYAWADLYRFLKLYAKLEGLLYLIGGQQRIVNDYCKPCGQSYLEALKSEDRKNAVLAVAYGVEGHGPGTGKAEHRRRPSKKASGRYRGLNIAPWVYGRRLPHKLRPDTTFEFRLHQNAINAKQVINWTHLCVAIVEWCAKASEADVDKLPKSALKALCQIAPKSRNFILEAITGWRKSTELGKSQGRRIDPRTWAIKAQVRIRRSIAQQQQPRRSNAAPGCTCSDCWRERELSGEL